MSHSAPITVIISVYNGAAYLAQTLDSVLAQAFSYFILLMIDDASTDATPAILAEYARTDARIRVLTNNHNMGVAASHNLGTRACDTPYIAPMGADDVVTPDWLAKKYAVMEARPDIAALGNALCMMGADGSAGGVTWSPPAEPQGIARTLFEEGAGIPHGSALIRTDVLRALGGYRENFAAALDLDLWLRMAEQYNIACLPDVLLHYRQHGGSISQAKAATQTYNHVLAMIASEHRRQGLPDPVEGRELTLPLLETLLQGGTYSALAWFNLLARRDVPDKVSHLRRACALAYDRPCTPEFLARQLPTWHTLAERHPQCMEAIHAAARRGRAALWKANVQRVAAGAQLYAVYERTLATRAATPEGARERHACARDIVHRMLA